ncbi:MAG: GtrA family protein [Gammaproteobacteria bacterium]|nr:GtrA family protein [Gammaproteobacteria bacterium]
MKKIGFKAIIRSQLFRFLVVGGINALFGYGLFCLLIALKLPHIAAISLAYLCGVLFNFQTTGRLVFNSHNNSLILRFSMVYILLYFVNIGCLEVLNHFIHNWYINGAITTIFAAGLSFILNKYWVFNLGE